MAPSLNMPKRLRRMASRWSSDCFLFQKLKEHISGTRFSSESDAKTAAEKWLNRQDAISAKRVQQVKAPRGFSGWEHYAPCARSYLQITCLAGKTRKQGDIQLGDPPLAPNSKKPGGNPALRASRHNRLDVW
ncbi:hypothetical protein AVEN_126647-1 [Araneus ventricosus]|uniref:DUF4817 domain-containing protein n=1 Tax=Araneus ventricosus TaxID=182803 RepID=A0A4Y2K4X9_ARAVE|nr:hypothetical protein AVEN_126647-1 [Araneus ventricosus]